MSNPIAQGAESLANSFEEKLHKKPKVKFPMEHKVIVRTKKDIVRG